MNQILVLAVAVLGLSLNGARAFGGDAGRNGVCMDGRTQLGYNNAQVLNWKTSTANQWKSRGFVQGVVTDVYPDRNGHKHFAILIGPDRAKDQIEVVYNDHFGKLPDIQPRMRMGVCGDYITSYAPTGQYPASPVGAIIHWVHGSPSPRHDDGFIEIDGKIYGQLGDSRH